jgi:G3E family GTPase
MQRDPLAGKLPITLVTGFLGSGKTTLIAKLLTHPDMNRVAVVINEVGEIGIDQDLVAMVTENIALLANGCLCCSVRTDLQDTLRELFERRRSGQIPEFDRVVIETTGLADPAPVVQTLASDALIAAHFRLDGLVTLLDALHGATLLAKQAEAIKQVALADRIVLTKADLVSADTLAQVADQARAINPRADQYTALHGAIEPSLLTHLGLSSARAGLATLTFLGERLADSTTSAHADAAGHDLGTDLGNYLGRQLRPHASDIQTLSLRFDTPFEWDSFSSALEMLTTLRGPDLLRVKGIVNIQGKPVVVQGVQHIFHPPVELDRWPSADQDTRLVVIARKMDANGIRNLFNAVEALSK